MDDTELQALPWQEPSTELSPLSFSLLSRSAGISKRVLGKHMK